MFTPTGEHREPRTSSYILPRADFEVRTPSLPLIGRAEQLTGNHNHPVKWAQGYGFYAVMSQKPFGLVSTPPVVGLGENIAFPIPRSVAGYAPDSAMRP